MPQMDKSGQQQQSRESNKNAILFRLPQNHFRNRNRDDQTGPVIFVGDAEFGSPHPTNSGTIPEACPCHERSLKVITALSTPGEFDMK
jgi:hypothetical protein